MKKLDKFDKLYNKFIMEWTQGTPLSNIVNDLKETTFDDCYQNKVDNMVITSTDNDIRSEFNNKFPCYLVKKCQSKFPIDDNIIVPSELVDRFWNKYSQKIIEKLAGKTVDCVYNVLTELFGNDNEYDENTFNDYAIELVKL